MEIIENAPCHRHRWIVRVILFSLSIFFLVLYVSAETAKKGFSSNTAAQGPVTDRDISGTRFLSDMEIEKQTRTQSLLKLLEGVAAFLLILAIVFYLRGRALRQTVNAKTRELEKSEAQFRSVFESMPLLMALWKRKDNDFFLYQVNAANMSASNSEIGKFLGVSLSEFYKDTPWIIESIENCYQTRKTIHTEKHYQYRTTGKKCILAFFFTYVPDDIVMAACEDITERKQMEEALRKSEERYRTIFYNSPLGIFRSTFEGRFLEVNPALADMLGYDQPETVLREIHDIGKQIYLRSEKREEIVSDQLESLNVKNYLNVYRRKDGAEFFANLYLKTVRDENGQPIFLEGIVEDITERQIAEAELDKNRKILEEAEKLAGMGGWEWDIPNDIWTMSDNWSRIHGCSGVRFKTTELLSVAHPDDDSRIRNAFDRSIENGEPYTIEHRIIRQDTGEIRYIQAYGDVKRDDSGKAIKLTGAAQDITERKQLEISLEKAIIDLRLAQRIASIGNWTLDPEIGTPEWSDEVYRIYERDPELGPYSLKDYETVYRGEWFDTFNTAIQGAILEGRPYEIELKLELPSGKNKWIHAICEADSTKTPKGYYLRGTIQDITARKQAEEALIESEERYRTIFEAAPISFIIHQNGDIIYINNSGVSILGGNTPDEFIGLSVFDFVHPDYRTIIDERVSRLEKNLSNPPLDIQILRKDGKFRFVESTSLPIVYKDKPAVLIMSIDITRRKETEAALRESEAKYRSIMESMRDEAYIISKTYRIEYMNPRMLARLGRDAGGEVCHKALYNTDERCHWCKLDKVRKGESSEYELTMPADERTYSVIVSPIRHVGGDISMLTIFRDITEIKMIEAQLRQAQKMESIGVMAGGVAHDFNNILYAILGNTELALDDIPADSCARSNLEEIKAASLRAAVIVRQLLNFSRKTDLDLNPIDAVVTIKEAIRFIRSTIPATISIEQKIPDIGVSILGDPTQIHQALINLCTNAYQAMEDTTGVIDIRVKKTLIGKNHAGIDDLTPGEYLEIVIRDTGPGIPPDIIDRIFDPYFTTKPVGKGTGMGLTVVHGIVKNHGGAIIVDSQPGKGTMFTLLFPTISLKPIAEDKTGENIPTGHETILFVDDEESIVNMTRKMLESLGYVVVGKINAMEALELFESIPDNIDLVITDMAMPQMSGIQLFEKLRNIRKDIPVIISTGHSTVIDEEKARHKGIDAFAMKPMNKTEIAQIVRRVLDGTSAGEQCD